MSDPCSLSNPENYKTNHINIVWNINFDQQILQGHVDLTMTPKKNNLTSLVLDSKDLKITKIDVNKSTNCQFIFGDKHEAFGSSLNIQLPKPTDINEKLLIHIEYSTWKSASALQWLNSQQTCGKQHPYMFSQCQAIHARSIMPCQDSPSDKFPYDAQVTVMSPLVALMSAVEVKEKRQQGSTHNTYYFTQKVPIPSYLVAIVSGKLECREIGPRTMVWTEKEMLDAAAYEFAETEKMIATGESIVGPYVWGRYDLLVLPPTFPYGGMENPCLTFVTPTLLAGDRSLANVVAHEIAHSWTGNLVTNKTWEHFWLNEGHTVFLERKIIKAFYGDQMRELCSLGGLKSLKDSVDLFGHDNPLTNLVVKLDGVDPDDSFSTVPYEKGYTLLYYLEQLLGGPDVFEPFLLAYINKFKYNSLTSHEWKDFLYQYFDDKKEILDSVDWNTWFNSAGMPPVIPKYDDSLLMKSKQLSDRWSKAKEFDGFSSKDIETMSSKQKIEFLAELLNKEPITKEAYLAIDNLYSFSKSGNSEIKFRWLQLGIKARVTNVIQPAITMATQQGRMKFTRPLFRSLGAWNESRQLAVNALQKNYNFMHSTTASLVAKDLKIEKF